MNISIITPVLNEASTIEATFKPLQGLRTRGHEIIVVDGGSNDQTVTLCRPLSDRVIRSTRGRAVQMNAGARCARFNLMLFLHADTYLPDNVDQILIETAQLKQFKWGCFSTRLSGNTRGYRIIEYFMNLRTRVSGIATGDKALFMWRESFQKVGCYPEIPLMEDIALSRKLKKLSRPVQLNAIATTSTRYWEQHGIWRTILKMWALRLAFYFGVSPERLAQIYYSTT